MGIPAATPKAGHSKPPLSQMQSPRYAKSKGVQPVFMLAASLV